MGYYPGNSDSYWENNNDYYSNNKDKFEELKETMRKHMSETQQLARDFEESTKEQERLTKLITELRKDKTSSLDMLLLLKLVMANDLADFDLVSDQVIAEAKEKYPEGCDVDCEREYYEIWLEGAAWMYYALMMKRPNTAYKTGQLTLDDAIKHCEEVLPLCENDEVREEHIQLGNWLKELRELKEWKKKINELTKFQELPED